LAFFVLADISVVGQAPPALEPVVDQQGLKPQSVRVETLAERERTAKELEGARAALDAAKSDSTELPPSLTALVEVLTHLDLTCTRVLAAIEHEAELTASKAQVTADLEKLRAHGVAEPRPSSFMTLESLHDQLATEISRQDSLADSVEVAQATLDAVKPSNDEKQRLRRVAKEAVDMNKDDAQASILSQALRMAELACRVASQQTHLREIELSSQRLESEIQDLRVTLLREKIGIVEANVQFSNEELQEILAQLDDQDYRLAQSIEWAGADLPLRDQQWLAARTRLDAAPAREPVLAEEVEARRLARLARQREVALRGQQQQVLTGLRVFWARRHESLNQLVDRATLTQREREAQQVVAQLGRDIRLHTSRLDELRNEARALDSKLESTKQTAPDAIRWVEEQGRQLGNLVRVFEDTLDREENARRLHVRYLAEIGTKVRTLTWREQLDRAWRVVVDIWNYEITSVQDSPITVKKIVMGALLLLLGTLGAKVVSRIFAQRFLPRFGLNEGALAAIQTLMFYVLLLTVAMLSLRLVNVPLTAFTILGGALAIGIGFGSQNIVNNFISGLILLAERPIRVGDLIAIEDLVGTVSHIGPRSTRVRAPENMDIVVPNSSFLEKNVVNWTLSDDRYRAHLTVGVAYGSPARDVGKLIRHALDEHGKVLPKPEPIILFADFGDNALSFEVHFWIRMRRMMDRRIIESDIRYRIDSLFREAGIVIAFPQRDVHLDSPRPISVRLVDDPASGGHDDPGDSGRAESTEQDTRSRDD